MSNENFENSLKKLLEMSDKIKSQNVSLEEAINCYEEGKKYYNICNEILENAKQKIETFEREE